MPYVNIVTSDRGWILERLAQEIGKRLSYVRCGGGIDPNADLQYYVTYSTWRRKHAPIEVCYFAHLEQDPGTRAHFFNAARSVNHCVCHSRMYEDMIREAGVETVSTISPGVDLDSFKPVVKVGVVGRTYHTGRKGEALVQQVMDVAGIEWHFTGDGWPGPARPVPGDKLPQFYNDMDYILVPAFYEGGPMCVVEALACGTPIIASRVGWVPEFPHIPFANGDAADLRRVLERIVGERQALRQTVLDRTWDAWAEGHDRLFQKLLADSGHTTNAQTSASPQPPLGKIVLLTHGSENKSLGGPTVRVPATAHHLRQLGCEAEAAHFPGREILEADLVHGFNVWSLETSFGLAQRAHALAKPFVFSPIFLDHREHTLWYERIPQLYAEQRALEDMDAEVAFVRSQFERDRAMGRVSAQAVPGHHALVRATVAMADHVICLSEHERRALDRIGATPAASSIVRNPVDIARFGSADSELFSRTYGIKDYIVCVARIEPRKNQLMLLQALHDSGIAVVLIGAVSNKAYGEAMKRHAGPNFHFIGRIAPDSPLIASALAGARVAVLPSWCEGAPLAALEAAAAGASMVLSDRSSEREYFGAFSRYCDPADPRSIRAQVLEAFNSQPDRTRREQIKAYVADQFSWTRYAQETRRVYEQTTQCRASRAAITDANACDRAAAVDATATPATTGALCLDLTTSANHAGRWTGIARFEMQLARALLAYDRSQVSFVAWHDPSRRFVPIDPVAIEMGEVKANLAFAGERKRRVHGVEQGCSLVVGGSAWMQNARYAEALGDFAAEHGFAFCPVFHDIIPFRFPQWFEPGYALRFLTNLKTVLQVSRRIISVSENTKRDIERFALEAGLFIPTIQVIREGDDFQGASEKSADLAAAAPAAELVGRDFVLAVGAIHVRKNYVLLANIWSRLFDQLGKACPLLVIVGGVAWNGKDVQRAFKEDPHLQKCVRVLEDVNDAALEWLYRSCIFTVYPSLYEGWGLPVGESLACGKICLASRSSSIPEIAPNETDLIDPLDFNAWYTRVLYYARSRSARAAREAEIATRFVAHSWAQTAVDFALALARPSPGVVRQNRYLVGTMIKVSNVVHPALTLRGWHARESWGTWSAHSVAKLALECHPIAQGKFRLVLCARALASRADPVSCKVCLAGQVLVALMFQDAATHLFTVAIPNDAIAERTSVSLEFHSSRLVQVSGFVKGSNTDDRHVGIGLLQVGIIDAKPEFVPPKFASAIAETLSTVPLFEEIDLRETDRATAILGKDIVIDSAWGARSVDGKPSFSLSLHDVGESDIEIVFRLRAVANAGAPYSAMIVANSEHVVGRLEVSDSDMHVHTITIPAQSHLGVQPLVLDFIGSGGGSPRDLGVGHDTAPFGVGFHSLCIQRSCKQATPSRVLGVGPLYEPGCVLFLGAKPPPGAVSATRYLVQSTWHRSETDGRWTSGATGNLDLYLTSQPQGDLDLRLTIAVPGELVHADAAPGLMIRVNDTCVYRSQRATSGFAAVIARVPAGLIDAHKPQLRISVSTDQCFVPSQHSQDARDDRILGVYVRDIVVAAAGVIGHHVKAKRAYELGSAIMFGSQADTGSTVSANGMIEEAAWHGPEAEGRWTTGRIGSLTVDLGNQQREELYLEMIARAGPSQDLQPRTLTVRANGQEIARQQRRNGRARRIGGIVPAAALAGRSSIRVEVEVDGTFQPSQVSASADERVLGVFVTKLIVMRNLERPSVPIRFRKLWRRFHS